MSAADPSGAENTQEEEEALARALAERPDEDIDMANGDDDYPDEAEEVGSHHRRQQCPHRASWRIIIQHFLAQNPWLYIVDEVGSPWNTGSAADKSSQNSTCSCCPHVVTCQGNPH